MPNASYDTHRAQIAAILTAWQMPPEHADSTAEVMAWADLHGVDSHGMSMLTVYDARRRAGRLRMQAAPRLERETPVSALIDADGGLGHVPSRLAMNTAIGKARSIGIGVVPVHNSAHFGACGFYAAMAAEAGMIGMVATSASGIQVAPTGGAQARLGTDPWAFAAPGLPGEPFLLDMATTTVAAGRIRNKANEGVQCPPGWVQTKDGAPSTDPLEAVEKGGTLTSLGGTPENASYKGYGLAAMVNILGSCLSGATLITDPQHMKKPKGMDIGHFFLALSPTLFRDEADFRADVASFCAALRGTPPINPARPVQVAGDPQRAYAAVRRRDGIPVGPKLLQKIRYIADEAGAPWLLRPAD
ncbi:Ldh family oxidoreductase [Acidisphaera sp. L21]|uniref:Ldh family oxidoreductase n=1 Tax=Acidisphaera sp. L21 TaxID=1641851 RepID=UPI00131BF39B|nr:Ldh family oxidoreductase [Acidisphaera sp. L21]